MIKILILMTVALKIVEQLNLGIYAMVNLQFVLLHVETVKQHLMRNVMMGIMTQMMDAQTLVKSKQDTIAVETFQFVNQSVKMD